MVAWSSDPPGSPPERPIPLTTFERYMWAEVPGSPMTALLQADFTGPLDRPAFEAAIAAALVEHPLLRATIDPSRKRRPTWIPRPDARPAFDWAGPDAPLAYTDADGEEIDLTREIGLRVWVRADESGGRVVFQLHHACTDGLGVLTFVLDVFRAYARQTDPAAPRPPRRDPALLARRGAFYPRFGTFIGRLRALRGVAGGLRRWRGRRLVGLTGPAAGVRRADDPPLSHLRTATLDRAESDALFRAARERGVTANDLMLRDLAVVLAPRCDGEGEDGLRLGMPVSLRDPADAAMPAANKLGMAFMTLPVGACGDADDLLRRIREKTQRIKTERKALETLEVLRLAQAVYGTPPDRLLAGRCRASAVLSNLGRIVPGETDAADSEGRLTFGDVRLDRIFTAPNGRAGVAAVVVALTYAGRLTLGLWFDPRLLSPASADGLLADYTGRLRASAAAGTAGPTTARPR